MPQSINKLKRNIEQHNMAVFQVSNSHELQSQGKDLQ